MNEPATIKLFLTKGDPTGLRTAELSNWSGKALAFKRNELSDFCAREESQQSGVYLLLGTDKKSDEPMIYIGEAEQIGKRLIQQRGARDDWNSVVAFVSKDENLTKGHIRYLEAELIRRAKDADRAVLGNLQSSNARLPESDKAEMNGFLKRVLQLLPILWKNNRHPSYYSAKL